MDIKKELQERGFKVKVVTRRHLRNDKKHYSMGANREFNFGPYVNPRGGEVEVKIVSPNGAVAKGISICHEVDNFDRKNGIKIAMERAISALEHFNMLNS